MPLKNYQNLLYKELSYQIQGAAIEVRKNFGSGHKESIYQNAFAEELKSRSINFEREKNIKIYSPKTKKVIGYYKPDFIVEGKVIIELKALEKIPRFLIDQLYDYLRNSEYELGYFINFSSPKLFIKRIIFTNDRKFSKLLVALSALLVVLSVAGILYAITPQKAFATTNIDSTYHWAWNDTIGWIDFYYTGNINVSSAQLDGYASSSVGYIALDCATSPSPNCTYSYKVSNDGSGNLSGWAWNDTIGWISFASSSPTYQVTINPSTGDFSGWAWNDIVGWISFNCLDINNCATSPNHKVKTAWQAGAATGTLTSSIFDTGVSSGVAINTIMWQGNKPSGTNVEFQIASNSSLGGGGGTGPIDSTYRYAWADSIGWIDFGYPAGNVNVGETQLTGYAYNDDVLEIALDCATTPGGDICTSQSNFKVNRATNGDLSGWAWNDNIGWISFCGNASGGSTWDGSKWVCPASPTYQVKVNPTSGAFTGWAWNDYVGWISVNCADPGLCDSSGYRVNTQTTATWSYFGPDGSNTTYYTPTDANMPVQINLAQHNNKRYFRYKIFLESNAAQTLSPQVDDIILNYSP